jgi:hypothetical protein
MGGAICTLVALIGCAQQPSVAENEVSKVVSKAVFAAAKELPRTYCLDPELKPSSATLNDQPDPEGWAVASIDPHLKYRAVPTRKLGKIPQSALSAFSRSGPGKDCHHTIEFEEPRFIEIKKSGERYMSATIVFDDPCPTCGAGYAVEFTKRSGKSWEMDPKGVKMMWIS